MTARPVPLTGYRSWMAAALVALAVLSGVWTMSTLVVPGPWRALSVGVVALLAAVTTALRQRTRSRTAPSAWGLALAVVVLGILYAGRGTTPSVPLPTPETVERFARLARSGITAIADGRIPMEPVRGLELLLVTGAAAAFLLADLLVLGLGRAGLSGLVVAGLWAPAIVFERTPTVATLALGGVAFLLLLVLTRPQHSQVRRSAAAEAGPALAAAAAVTVLALVAGPLASAAPFFGSVRLPSAWGTGTGGGPLRLSTELDMRSSLTERSDRPVLTYTTDADDLGPLRMYTMVDFDGTEWARGQDDGSLTPARGWLLPPGVPEPAPQDTRRVTITIGDLDQDRLPIPTGPRDVDIQGTWLWDPTRDEVVGRGSTTRGAQYVVTVGPRPLTPDALRADSAGEVESSSPYLIVPESAFVADIRATAEQVTAGATTTYDQALALQTYFRDIAAFRYDPRVPPAQTDDAVWDFLTQRTGYCVQYATAMTIMARAVGIPARLAIGFLPGRPNTEVSGQFVVSGRQAHAWPELYFAEAGWVRFEPTPAAQTGAPPVYADPYAAQGAGPNGELPTASAETPVTPGAAAAGAAGDGGVRRVTIGSTSVPLILVLGGSVVVLVLGGLFLSTLMKRAMRRSYVPQGPDAWWDVLRARLEPHGVSWSDATTPRQAAETIRARYRSLPAEAGEAASAALDHLVAAVEAERYGPAPQLPGAEDLERWVDAVERPFVQPVAQTLVGAAAR